MYFAAKHKDVKLAQDYADCIESESKRALIICDGIGEFEQSGIAAKIVVEQLINTATKDDFDIKLSIKEAQKEISQKNITGGTTLLSAIQSGKQSIDIHFLGNGGIIHLYGNFATNPYSDLPYRYAELMNPHVTPDGALIKHISFNSGELELDVSTLNMSFNSHTGDIILLFSDGISSLEEKAIMKTDDGELWRHENESIQFILKQLNNFLIREADGFTADGLNQFLEEVLISMKDGGMLEDDASLGIVLTENVINWYKSRKND
ncbi:hypothetical protein [uncultured Draconibacterium sp.]|uniref:hypothetical protein n=1 Tax=uncultured Draconibacterium sp. TaxID=1573823 RepID=UPI003216CCE4